MRKTPVVLGILSMIFGGVVALWSAIGLFVQSLFGQAGNPLFGILKSMPRSPGQPDPSVMLEQMQNLMRELAVYTQALTGVKALLSVALFAIGWGLMKRANVARKAALIWSGFALSHVVAESIVQMTIVGPRTRVIMDQFLSQLGPMGEMQRKAQAGGQVAGIILGALINAAFPLLLIIFLGRRSAKNDFVG